MTANLANGMRMPCIETNGVIVQCQDRETEVRAVVIPSAKKVLLGVLPLEGMDLMVDPKKQTLVGVHGDEVVCTAF
jgi:hypothetical protein